jgi:hypothetical protein
MINSSNHGDYQLTRQAMLWRLILTALLLLFLTISSLTIFKNVTSQPDAQVLPTLPYEVGQD